MTGQGPTTNDPRGLSRFIERWCEANPDDFATLQAQSALSSDGEWVIDVPAWIERSGADFPTALRHTRNACLAAIAWRDLSGLDELDTTLIRLSDLADQCIDAALRHAEAQVAARYDELRDQQGRPVRLIVIGMGKLGGNELNFSSDVDLIFAYRSGIVRSDSADPDVAGYFRRVAQRTIQLLSETTAQGFVYRVDTRLRPFGDAGALIASIAAMEQYYQAHGREWERYAWIKARPVAGDLAGGQLLIDTLRPFVYRRYLDYGAFESIREMKTLIDREVARRDSQANIKLGYGGIREIEFLVQVFQLVRGGQEPELQNNRLRPTLARLAASGHITRDTAEKLDANYVFLRRLENRLQIIDDQQTHDFPADDDERARLACAMNGPDGERLAAEVERVRSEVHALFEQVFAAPETKHKARASDREQAALEALWADTLAAEEADDLLRRYGIDNTVSVVRALAELKNQRRYRMLESRGRRWLGELVPALIVASAHNDAPERALLRTLSVISEIVGRSNYVALLVEYPAALTTLLKLCGASEWITEQIAEQPALLDSLLDRSQLYHAPRRTELAEELTDDLAAFEPSDLEQRMDALRRFTHRSMLRIAAADVTHAMPLMIVSDHLTELAEVALAAALDMAWYQMSVRYGEPRIDNDRVAPFAVIAYGKLGGLELGYRSDLDLVFLYDSPSEAATSGGERELTHQVFFTRLAQRLIHILKTATPAGRAYDIDMRLRPSGNAGLMVSHIDAFARYQKEKAWTWEHQALVRARYVAGDPKLGERFGEVRREILAAPRDVATLARQVCAMRDRMRDVKDESTSERLDVKQMAGGLIDIEFIAQFAALRYGPECPEILIFTDAIRILETLESAAIASYDDIKTLTDAYRRYRRTIHADALQRQRAMIAADQWPDQRNAVARIWQDWIAAVAGENNAARARDAGDCDQ